jgi:hypothetical protein
VQCQCGDSGDQQGQFGYCFARYHNFLVVEKLFKLAR